MRDAAAVVVAEQLAASADVVAPRLLGWRLVRDLPDGTRLAGRIVETEAYLGPRDRAAHSFGGRRTARTEPMFANAGTAYVYFVYGAHWCVNVVCAAVGEPQAVLIRAVEPVEGVERMRARRLGIRRDRDLTSGPGKVCAAMGIDGGFSGADLLDPAGVLRLEVGGLCGSERVGRSARIGVGSAGAWARRRLRWFVVGSEFVSRGTPTRAEGS